MNIVMILGGVIALTGAVWFIVEAFKEGTGWGIACILFPPTCLYFFIRNFETTWKPFVLMTLGSVVASIPSFYLRYG